jgi:hypothetical protein
VNNLFDPPQNLEAQWQPGIDAGTGLSYHTGTKHQPVADDLRLGRRFFENG